jgi:CRISPR-associated protein Cas1
MGTLYLDQAGTELRLRDGALELRRDGRCQRSLPTGLLERVVLRADTMLSSGTLAALADAGIGVVALGGRSGQRVAHVLGAPHGDARARIGQCQKVHDADFAAAWCAHLLRAKLRAQQRLLRRALAERPDLRYQLTTGLRTVDQSLAAVRAGPNSRETLRGLEGAAAAAYFRAYASLFAPTLGFERRRRRPPPDPVNACLSLGYTLLYAQAVQACWAAGLDPMVGLLHLPTHGRASLACDLMEPWRPRVDAWVWHQFREGTLRPDHFGRDGAGACIVGKAARAHLYTALTPLQRQWGRALRRHARLAAVWLASAATLPPADDDPEDGEAAEFVREN